MNPGGAGGSVTINGGTVIATGVDGGAGIGGGQKANGGDVTINGGDVTATGGESIDWSTNPYTVVGQAPGIGGGFSSNDNGTLNLGADVSLIVSTDNSAWMNYDGSTRAPYMKTGKVHVHDFTYSADGAAITATCTEEDCDLTDSKATLTIVAPMLTTYGQTGEDISAAATLTGLDDFNTATSKTVAETEIKYVGRDGTTYDENEAAPSAAGKYTAKITVEGVTASVDYEIAKADPTVTAPTANTLNYNGQPQALVTAGEATGGTMWYAVGTDETTAPTDGWSQDIPEKTDVGKYYVWYKVVGDENHEDTEPESILVKILSLFISHSLSLDSDIGVNFYLNLTDEQAACATITFKWMKNGSEKTEVVNLSEENRTRYGYKTICRVSASEVRAEINAHLVINAGQDEQIEETDTYSVATYANVILNDAEYASSYSNPNPNQTLEKLRILVSALLDYGDHANAYFDANAAALATPAVVIPAEYAESAYYSVTDLPEGVTFEGATLSLRSQTTLSLYFKKTASVSDEVVLTMDGKIENKDYERKQSGNEYVIRIRNIAAPELNTVFTVKVNGTGIVNYSPLTYCYKAQSSSDTKLANTVKALYKFWQEANRFFSKETD